MKKLAIAIVALALAPAIADAQIRASASFSLDLPVILPPLVVIQPGIQVVPDVDYEVFHVDGFYWTRHEGGWYRSSNPRSGWVHMPRNVPPGLSRMPPGKYKRWKGPAGHGPGPAVRAPERRDAPRQDRHDGDRGGKKHGKGHDKH